MLFLAFCTGWCLLMFCYKGLPIDVFTSKMLHICCIQNVWIVFQHGLLQEEEDQSLSDYLNKLLLFGFCLNWP